MKKYHKIKYSSGCGIVLCLFLVIFLFQFREAKAEGPSFSVAPHSFNVSALGGEEVSQKIKIINRGDTAIPMRLRVDGFTAKDETGDMVDSSGDAQENFVDWFEFEKDSFVIDAGKTENVAFTVKVPVNAPLKGYYAVIFIEADISPFVYNESKVQTIPGIGAPFLLKVGNQEIGDSLTVLDYQISEEHRLKNLEKVFNFLASPFFSEEVAVARSGEHSFFVRMKNDGIYHSKVSGKIRLSGLGWKLDREIEIPSTTILPGKTRKILVGSRSEDAEESLGIGPAIGIRSVMAATEVEKGDEKVGFGLMKASLELESDDGIQKEESRWVFVFSWWLVFLFFAGLFMIITLVMFLSRMVERMKKKIALKIREKSGEKFNKKSSVKESKLEKITSKENKIKNKKSSKKRDHYEEKS